MKASWAALDLIMNSEGCELKAYQKPGDVPTIGWGHTHGVYLGMTCTREQAEKWLAEDIREVEEAVDRMVKVALTQHQYDALCSFVFNEGAGKFHGSTLLRKLNEANYDGAAKEFKKWVYADGKVLRGLVTRRQAEEALFRGA